MSGGLSHKVIAYLGRTPNFLTEVVLSDGEIETWKATDKAKPTMEQLNALQSEADKIEKSIVAIGKRRREYGSTAEQLEYIVENGVDAFVTKQNQIKLDNPKS